MKSDHLEHHALLRRALLRGAVYAGLLSLPWVSRADPLPTGGSGPAGRLASGANKLSQAKAEYQDTPKDGHECAKCTHFVASNNTCKVVEGNVSPTGWCVLWAAKQA